MNWSLIEPEIVVSLKEVSLFSELFFLQMETAVIRMLYNTNDKKILC